MKMRVFIGFWRRGCFLQQALPNFWSAFKPHKLWSWCPAPRLAEWVFDAAQGVFEVFLGGFDMASAALTAVSCPQKGPAGSKSARAKNGGGVLFISRWWFLTPAPLISGISVAKKEDLTGFATQQDTSNTEQYWAISGIWVVVLTRNYYRRVTFWRILDRLWVSAK